MLVNLKEILIPAKENHTAVGHFNVINLEMARAVIAAAEEEAVPIVLGIEEGQSKICPMEEFASFALEMAFNAAVPVAVHLDHGKTFSGCMRAVKLGFTSVNYDCSGETLEENQNKVAEMVKIAHSLDASVEAELGRTPEAAELADGEEKTSFTDPEQAAEYVRNTGIDALAISVGSAHGQYMVKPKIDYERIRAISSAADIPLVMHGGSGLSDSAIRKSIEAGITKIDIFTDLDISAAQGCIQAVNDGVNSYAEIIPYIEHSVKTAALEKIRLLQNR
ncbi:MAG: class II fructose-bisphosphate aldolase [Lachnospiraceae bacterium]|nr:class II fructose-bisphosphate aldolase [Lachnospiraceae bacterium]